MGGDRQVMWLKDFLPNDLPTARILSYGYDSGVLSAGSQSFGEIARNLVELLDLERINCKGRHIIFIAHALGGLVVKKALVTLAASGPKLGTSKILESTRGIIFLATPHRGIDSRSWSTILGNTFGVFKPRNGLLDLTSRTSETLMDLNHDFVRLNQLQSILIFSFYETMPSPVIRQKVVEKESAFLGLPMERLISLSVNHSHMTKFHTPDDEGYGYILESLEKTLETTCLSATEKDAIVPPLTTTTEANAIAAGVSNHFHQKQTSGRQRLAPRTPQYVFDSLSDFVDMETGSGYADDWFVQLRDKIHPVIRERHKDSHIPIKVAVIDSGVDGDNTFIKGLLENKQLICKSFIPGVQDVGDVCGHGTHVAHLLFKIAPRIELYVARVFVSGQSSELDRNKLIIAEASNLSLPLSMPPKTWEVDVLSISWGYRGDIPAIRTAIRDAFHKGIILFAAASNSGAIERYPIAFPANMRQVICINSNDGFGNPSGYNPSPMDDCLFSIIGEGIEAAWPVHLGTGTTKVCSGTSVATPIAAGVAALILEYARQEGNAGWKVENHKRIFHCDEMRKVLRHMSNPHNNFSCLVPAKLFEETGLLKHARICSRISDILDSPDLNPHITRTFMSTDV